MICVAGLSSQSSASERVAVIFTAPAPYSRLRPRALAAAARAAAAACLLALAPAAAAQQSPDELRESALRALQDGDLPTAAQMLEQLGDQGVPQGYTMLGQIKRDLGDYPDAARWFEHGAEGGDVTAMLEGGEMLSDPRYGIADARRAFKLWRAAAERGAARGQYEAGRALMTASGVRGDDRAGADWLEKAARQCFPPGQLAYALALREGRGREADGEQALAWIVAAQRASEDWRNEDLERLAALEREISAYMSSEQVRTAYCAGLDLLAEGCGSSGILFRIERWLVCD